ncbi:hypothetical protein SDC9_46698 [bioreactor metagenome]|uniref:Tripartite ATP-independent periplasmic transporters DctQ component domain-containing protein n=1 Tax=bioreactor metagenome TaxID=1076179 RepID=A0A644W9Q1_9ZZZZ
MFKTLTRILTTIEKRALQFLFLAMTIVVLIQVFNRITVNFPMAWSDELSRYLFVWMIFIAAAYAAGEKAHIGVTAVIDLLPEKYRRVVELIIYVLCLAFSIALIYYTFAIIKVQLRYGQISPSMRMPMQYAYSGMAVGGLFMATHFVLHIYNFFAEKKNNTEGVEKA